MHDDPTGHWIHIAMGALVGAVVNTAITAYQDYKDDGKFNSGLKSYAVSAAQGAIAGAVGAATGGAGLLAGAAINGAVTFAGSAIEQKAKKGTISWKKAAIEGGLDAALTVGGHYVGKFVKQTKVAKLFEAKVNNIASKTAAFVKEKAGIFKDKALNSATDNTIAKVSNGIKKFIREEEGSASVIPGASVLKKWVGRNTDENVIPIKNLEVTTYRDFNARSIKGDNLEGHELLQHAFLKDNGLVNTRLSNDVSKNNSVIALERELHSKVNSLQAKTVDFRNQTGRQNIEANLRILRQFDLPEKQLRKLTKKAVKHAQDLGVF